MTTASARCCRPDIEAAFKSEIAHHGLCALCTGRLARILSDLPGLYAECGESLSVAAPVGERVSGSPRDRNMSFDAAVADARSSVVDLLVSWAALVVEERVVPAPPRTVPHLAAFLLGQLTWLSRHPAAQDALEEFHDLVARTRAAVRPDHDRHLVVGRCVHAGCGGRLEAAVNHAMARGSSHIQCSSRADHRWSAHEWLMRSRRVSSPDSAGAGSPRPWVGVGEVVELWDLSAGSVYRTANEHGWRRRRHRGRVYYHHGDVAASLAGKGSRRAVPSDTQER